MQAGACFGLTAPVPGEIRAAGSGFDRQLKPGQPNHFLQALVWPGVVRAAGWGGLSASLIAPDGLTSR